MSGRDPSSPQNLELKHAKRKGSVYLGKAPGDLEAAQSKFCRGKSPDRRQREEREGEVLHQLIEGFLVPKLLRFGLEPTRPPVEGSTNAGSLWRSFVTQDTTDLAIKMCVFYAESRISHVTISSGRVPAISHNLVHSLKAKSVDDNIKLECTWHHRYTYFIR